MGLLASQPDEPETELKAPTFSLLVKMHTDDGIVGIADSGGTSAWYRGESQHWRR